MSNPSMLGFLSTGELAPVPRISYMNELAAYKGKWKKRKILARVYNSLNYYKYGNNSHDITVSNPGFESQIGARVSKVFRDFLPGICWESN
jgi:hypothetical protein